MYYILRSIDIKSPSDGKHYTSLRQYERSLESRGQYIMDDKTFRELREKLNDEIHSAPKQEEPFNHVDINLATGQIVKSVKDVDAS